MTSSYQNQLCVWKILKDKFGNPQLQFHTNFSNSANISPKLRHDDVTDKVIFVKKYNILPINYSVQVSFSNLIGKQSFPSFFWTFWQ